MYGPSILVQVVAWLHVELGIESHGLGFADVDGQNQLHRGGQARC
jgi:hypothetical protein